MDRGKRGGRHSEYTSGRGESRRYALDCIGGHNRYRVYPFSELQQHSAALPVT